MVRYPLSEARACMRTSPRGVAVGSPFLFRSESGSGEGDRRRVKGEAMNTSDIIGGGRALKETPVHWPETIETRRKLWEYLTRRSC